MKTDYKKLKESVRIIDYARYIGLTPCRVGSYYSLKEHDSVRIDLEKNIFYRNSTGEHGTVIDFALAFTGKKMADVIKELEEFAGSRTTYEAIKKSVGRPKEASTENVPTVGTFSQTGRTIDVLAGKYGEDKELLLPEPDIHMRNVFAYLTKTRLIDQNIVERMVKDRMLYQDIYKNCVFVSREGNRPVFGCVRGTNTYKRFIADVLGSDYSKGFLIRRGSKDLYVVEGVIDALSLMTMKQRRDEAMPDFLCLSGATKEEAAYNRLRSERYEKVYIALDNDKAGREAAERISQNIKEQEIMEIAQVEIMVPKYKDWNEDLVKED